MSLEKGLIQIYTGDGKGKTTAAFGLVLRALGRGFNVAVFQFLKGATSGEVLALDAFKDTCRVYSCNSQKKFVWHMNDAELDQLKRDTVEGFEQAKQLSVSEACDILILDEAVWAVNHGYIDLDEMLEFLKNKSDHIEIILTGRNACKDLIKAADLVTEMKKIKHPFDQGVNARMGIEK